MYREEEMITDTTHFLNNRKLESDKTKSDRINQIK